MGKTEIQLVARVITGLKLVEWRHVLATGRTFIEIKKHSNEPKLSQSK